MNEMEKAAHAIGYLRGISAVLWNLDGPNRNVDFSVEEAAYYDQQVDVLHKALFGKDEE